MAVSDVWEMSHCARDDGGDEGSANCSAQSDYTYRIHRADMTGTLVRESTGRPSEVGETEEDPSQPVQFGRREKKR